MPTASRSTVRYGRTRIGYTIRRSLRRGTVAIAIDPQQGVLVTAPGTVSVDRLDMVVLQKGRWIIERLRNRTVLERPSAREFVSGETFRYLGSGYRLKVKTATEEAVALRGGWLNVAVGSGYTSTERADQVRRLLADWYRGHARERLPGLVDQWAARLRVQPTSVLVREAAKRWGSCDARGNLRLNWRIVQARRRHIDYVVAHELMHLRHQHHTATFWSDLGRVMPDYERRREDLRQIGATFIW